jgi:SAM-dependent methyltransferase
MASPDILRDEHNRYLLQAQWTAENRRRLFLSANIHRASHVLEVGSGTSVILHDIAETGSVKTFGIDIDSEVVHFSQSIDPKSRYVVGDGMCLPYRNGTFDATICHFLLMWVSNPLTVLREMSRVVKYGGVVLALAEPDYGGRIDFPETLQQFGQLQAKALEAQGADTQMGRKLRMLFTRTGLENIHTGVLGGEWYGLPDEMTLHSEWKTLSDDLEGRLSKEQMENYQELDRSAWLSGTRILYVPTFYAIGWQKQGI